VDSSDVLAWYTIGQLASAISNYSLARHAFETVCYSLFCVFFMLLIIIIIIIPIYGDHIR